MIILIKVLLCIAGSVMLNAQSVWLSKELPRTDEGHSAYDKSMWVSIITSILMAIVAIL